MRKNQLRQQVDHYCFHDHTGSHRAKRHRYFVLHKMIRDLFHLGHVPPKWYAVTQEHIQGLVAHWQKKGIRPSTLMKYMTVIRDFFQKIGHKLPNISNQSLGIKNPKVSSKVIHVPEDMSTQLANPIANILMKLQIHFGLTLSEAMRLCPSMHIKENELWITRTIATNSKDRMIPLRNEAQIEAINSFLGLCKEQSLIATYGYHSVRDTYSKELKSIGMHSSKSYRSFYAKNIYPELSGTLSPYLAKQTIMREMGLQSRRTLWSYLNE